MNRRSIKAVISLLMAVIIVVAIPLTAFASADKPSAYVGFTYTAPNKVTATITVQNAGNPATAGGFFLKYDPTVLSTSASGISITSNQLSNINSQVSTGTPAYVFVDFKTSNDTTPFEFTSSTSVATVDFTINDGHTLSELQSKPITFLAKTDSTDGTIPFGHNSGAFLYNGTEVYDLGAGTLNATLGAMPAPVAVTGVSLDKTEATATVGEQVQLTATVAPADAHNKAVTWKSSDESVATVDNTGKVSTLKAGPTTITVTTADGGKTATCALTVNAASTTTVAVTGVTVDPTNKAATVGDTFKITATVAPADASNKAVTWSTSDATIATVDTSGNVTAKAEGPVTITATTVDGEKKASCAVTVAKAADSTVAVTGLTLDKTEATILTGSTGNTVQLTATVAPANATNKAVTWSSSAPTVATVDTTGKVTSVGKGTAVITATTADGGKTAACTVTVNDPVAVTGVSLDKSTATVATGKSINLTATVAPTNATNKAVTWRSSNPAVATVDSNGKVTGVSTGSVTITATSADGTKQATCAVNVTTSSGSPDTGDEIIALYPLIIIIIASLGIAAYCIISSRNNRAARKAYAASGAMRADNSRPSRRRR